MTVLEQIDSQESKAMGSLIWSAALVASLGKPEEWEYSGIVTQAGPPNFASCACGHPIMDCFHIKHPSGRTAIVGSTCIGYFQEAGMVYASLSAAVKELATRRADAKKAAKAAADEVKVTEAKNAFDALYGTVLARFQAFRANGRMAPRELWYAMASHYRIPSRSPEYQRACDYLKWYAKQTAYLNKVA